MAMKQARIGLLLAAAILTAPSYALAQKAGAKPAKAAKGPAKPAPAAAAPAAPADTTPKELDADGPATPGAGADQPAAPAEGGLGDICQIDPSACPNNDLADAAKHSLNAQIYAVQQIYALRYHRFELQPTWAFTLNDQFVSHPGPVVAANFYLTNVMAIGINGGWYQGLNQDQSFNAEVRRAARVAVPLTEYQWAGALNFTYVPMYGKFAGFSDFIFHWDAYVVGGVGAISTRPIAVVDPDNRIFQWKPKAAFNAGLGVRVFFNRWFAAILEVRDYIFADQLEATSIAATPSGKADSGTWYGDNKLTNNIQAQLGVSVFLPFSWEYRLPK